MAASRSIKGRNGLRPKKRLGQHFLKDRGIIREIITRAGFYPSDHILEIGAGLGALTIPLAGAVHQIIAVEKDPRLTGMLRKRLSRSGINNVILINDDVLRLDFPNVAHLSDEKMKVIGNLPYNISSPFLETLVKNRNLVSKAILMFQIELAQRLVASPGSKTYGAMTVLIQYYAHLSPLLEVPKEAFYPRPKVDSMVLQLDFERPHPRRADDEAYFKKIVKDAFAHRRKTLLNSMKDAKFSPGKDKLSTAFEKCAINPGTRAETLDIDDFLCLVSVLSPLLDK